MDLDKILNIKEASELLGFSERWIRENCDRLPGFFREGSRQIRCHPRTYLVKRIKGFVTSEVPPK